MPIPLFLDFDDTLCDTGSIKRQLCQLFEAYGIQPAEFWSSYDDLRSNYDPIEHAQRTIGEVSPTFLKSLDTIYTGCKDLVYPDVLPFLSRLDRSTYRPILLTHGHDTHQRRKVEGSGLEDYFEEILTCQHEKWLAIQAYIDPKEPFLLADDRIDTIVMLARQFPKFYGIVVNRKGTERPSQYPFFQISRDLASVTTLPLPERFPPLVTAR